MVRGETKCSEITMPLEEDEEDGSQGQHAQPNVPVPKLTCVCASLDKLLGTVQSFAAAFYFLVLVIMGVVDSVHGMKALIISSSLHSVRCS
eukprot:3220318-Amphidinium_carterae.2